MWSALQLQIFDIFDFFLGGGAEIWSFGGLSVSVKVLARGGGESCGRQLPRGNCLPRVCVGGK